MEKLLCQVCGEPMPEGEEMFNYHGYSGPCPRPPLATPKEIISAEDITELERLISESEADQPAYNIVLDIDLAKLILSALRK